MPIKNQLMSLMGKTEQPVKAVPAAPKPVAPSKPAPPKPSVPSSPSPIPKLEASEVKQVAEASLSPQLLRKLLSDEKLSTDEQKQVAAVCNAVGFL